VALSSNNAHEPQQFADLLGDYAFLGNLEDADGGAARRDYQTGLSDSDQGRLTHDHPHQF
jgi:hypothetical protein